MNKIYTFYLLMGRIVREDGSLAASCEDKGKDGRRDHDRNLLGEILNLQVESEKKEWIRQEELVRLAYFNIKSKFQLGKYYQIYNWSSVKSQKKW